MTDGGRDGIEHDGRNDLVDLDLDLEYAGDQGVNAAREDGGQRRKRNDEPGGLPLKGHADLTGHDRAEQELTLAADVEDADAGAEVTGQAAEGKDHCVFQHVAPVAGIPEGALDHGGVGLERRVSGDPQDERADEEGQEHADQQRKQIASVPFPVHEASSFPFAPSAV